MCGLFGHSILRPGDPARSVAALETLAHRGPDLRAHWSDEKVFLGHARLSILDLSERGSQPMADEKGDCVITVNGEIYSFETLREELSQRFQFQSASDSEVVLHGYRAWGLEGLLSRIEGMYALTIYDKRQGQLHVARDRVGIKPLYMAVIDGQFAWASELKALETYFGPEKLSADYTAFYDFLTYRYVPNPKTMYKEVQKLPPGHAATFDLSSGNLRTWAYWQLEVTENPDLTVDFAREQLRDMLARSVNEQMISDVPVGFFLSGGVDSGAVVSTAALKHDQLDTYFIGFERDPANEDHFARLVADRYGTRHTAKTLPNDATEALFLKLREWFDEPFADSSAMPTFHVSALARERSTVVLTGDGGDEVFGGYTWYNKIAERTAKNRQPDAFDSIVSTIKRRARRTAVGKVMEHFETRRGLSGMPLHLKLANGMLKDEKSEYRALWEIPDDYDDLWHFRRYDRPDLPLRTRLQFIDFHTFLPDCVLTKVDRTSMAVSLEVRVPLLATEIVEFGFSLPEDVRYLGSQLKGLFKSAVEDRLPAEVISRPKRGFGVPRRSAAKALVGGHATRQERVLRQLYPEYLRSR